MSGDNRHAHREERLIRHFQLSTADERADHQFDLWHSAMEATIDVSRPHGEGQRQGFAARLDAFDLGAAGLISMRMPGEGHTRSWSHVHGPGPDHWVVMVPVGDRFGAEYRRRPIGFGSLGRPFTGSSADTKVVGLFIARDSIAQNRAALDSVPGAIRDIGMTRLLTDFLLSLEGRLARGEPFRADVLSRTVADMVLACLLPRNSDRLRAAQGALEATLLEQAAPISRAISRCATSAGRGSAPCSDFRARRSIGSSVRPAASKPSSAANGWWRPAPSCADEGRWTSRRSPPGSASRMRAASAGPSGGSSAIPRAWRAMPTPIRSRRQVRAARPGGLDAFFGTLARNDDVA